jgi:hypothetical protein
MAGYYSFNLTSSGTASSSAYYYVSLVANENSYDGAAITIYPSSASSTYVSYQSASVSFQAPPARIAGGITVVANAPEIAGTLGASPAVNVDQVLKLYGPSGLIGTVTLPAGKTSVPFDFHVSTTDGLDPAEAAKNLEKFGKNEE